MPTVQTDYAQAMNQHYAYAQGVEAAAQDTAEKARNNRPKNTIKSYESKKKEFLRWCHTHCPPGPLNEIVEDRKLHFFLLTQVLRIYNGLYPISFSL